MVWNEHLCEVLKNGKHNLRVLTLTLADGKMQWFLVNDKTRFAECVLYCPYCGQKLEPKSEI